MPDSTEPTDYRRASRRSLEDEEARAALPVEALSAVVKACSCESSANLLLELRLERVAPWSVRVHYYDGRYGFSLCVLYADIDWEECVPQSDWPHCEFADDGCLLLKPSLLARAEQAVHDFNKEFGLEIEHITFQVGDYQIFEPYD